MNRRPCTRCKNGWLVHPSGEWAVACPQCQPDGQDTFWLAVEGSPDGRVVRRYQLPPDHPSQREVRMPDYCRAALTAYKAKRATRDAVLEPDHRRSA